MITYEQATQLFRYDPDTGHIYNRATRSPNSLSGSMSGCISAAGYICLSANNHRYLGHRVAWLLHYGVWPKADLDHINGDPLDNSVTNLREVTPQENQRNAKKSKSNNSGHTGVLWREGKKKWLAQICVSGRTVHIGAFTEKDDAITARKIAEIEHGFHPNHGR